MGVLGLAGRVVLRGQKGMGGIRGHWGVFRCS